MSNPVAAARQVRAGTYRTAVSRAAPVPHPPAWLWISTLALSLLALGVSVYLTIEHYTGSTTLACSASLGNCLKVTTSPESVVFGVFPVAVLGLAFYVFLTAITTPWAWRSSRPQIRWVRLCSVIVGIGFVMYLIYTELFTLDAICPWCTSVHVVTFVLFALIVYDTTFRRAVPARTGKVLE